LRDAIQRSYQLLNDQERARFRTLGVFVDGFDPEALAHLQVDEITLQSLIDKSLVQVVVRNDARRFLLLETLREYAWEQLCAEGEADAAQRLHAETYLRLAEEAASHFRRPDQVVWRTRLAVEHGNLRAALTWALASRQADTGARLGAVLWRFWYIRGDYAEGQQWLQQLLAQTDQPQQRANLLYGQGMLARRRGDSAAAASSLAASLAIFRQLGNDRMSASALRGLGFVYYLQHDYARACPLLEEALALFRSLDDQEGIAVTLDSLGYITRDPRLHQESLALRRRSGNLHGIAISLAGLAYRAISQADYAAARMYLQEHRQINEALGNQNGIAVSLFDSGLITFIEGDYTAAQVLYTNSLRICQETGERLLLPSPILGLGATALKHAEYDRARALFEQALVLFQEIGDVSGVAKALKYLAGLAVTQCQAHRTLYLAGAAAALCERLHIEHLPFEQEEFERAQAAARQLLGETAAAAAWAAGQAMTVEEAVAFALTR
jgi:tetratricopeptide (TPR) repeat protein